MPNKFYFLIAAAAVTFSICFAGCAPNSEIRTDSTAPNSNPPVSEAANFSEPPDRHGAQNSETAQNNSCADLKRSGFALDKKQTFAVDFAPFEKSCFATFYDPEFTNSALGAEYFIYKNGAESYAFPEQFNGGNAVCRVEGVTFEDLNADRLKDVIVVGKCGAKSEAYYENMVYINTGRDFKINKDANMEMMDFSKVSRIKDYVRRHRESFSR